MPGGEVLLPGLDLGLADDVWGTLEPSHPQAGLRALLAAMGAERRGVRLWPASLHGVPEGRARTIAGALLPAPALGAWKHSVPVSLDGLTRLDPADQQEEAVAIAMAMREALERQGERVALVTPDRDLAGRIAVELRRWGILADDSAGEPLADTPPGVFLRLVATAVAQQLAPVPLLAMLKHPLAAAGLAAAECRAGARALELACLRGPRPGPGLAGLRRALDLSRRDHPRRPAALLLERMEACLEPVLRKVTAVVAPPAELMTALIEAAEYLASTDEEPGPARLWASEEGEALAARLASVQAALPMLPDQPPAMLPGLLDAALERAVVRSRRALRGGQAAAEHPRVAIWGLLEARLQSADTIVLGGLTEGVWPPAADPGPWMSRAMRQQIGLDSPERIIGQTAHDFAAAVCAAPHVVLSCPRRRDGAPAVPTRWLVRLHAFLAGQQSELTKHPATGWARLIDQPADGPRPVSPPRPCPPLAARPRQLSVTEIETWLSDPYAIYAKHVLALPALDPLDQSTDAADYGSIVHAGLHEFLREHGTAWPPNAAERLSAAMELAIRKAGLRPALVAWWSPRVARIAEWVAAEETRRRSEKWPVTIASEVRGLIDFERPGGAFRLVGRADRVEQYADGSLAILDYKTGYAPSQREVETGFAPQLPLEALMAEAGAFATVEGPVRELIYWHLTGGFVAGEVRSLFRGDAAAIAASVDTCRQRLLALIDAYDDPARCYLSRPHPATAPRFSHYTQLARVAEWEEAGDED
jgi:ATP-dependent helicase/nuclease subunit B